MGKWQKKLALIAGGSVVIGALLVGAGVLSGGIQDVQHLYAAVQGKEYQYDLKLEQIEKLDVDLSDTYVRVETGDVNTTTVTYSTKEDGNRFIFAEDESNKKLTVTDNVDYHSKTVINTDFFEIFKYINGEHDHDRDEIIITLPTGSDLEKLKLTLHTGTVFLKDLKIKDFDIESTDSAVTVIKLETSQSQLSLVNGGIYFIDSQLPKGVVEVIDGTFVADETKIKDFSINSTDSHLSFAGKLEEVKISGQNTVIGMGKVDYQGNITIDSADSTVSFDNFYRNPGYSFDFEVIDGEIYFNDDLMTESYEGFKSDELVRRWIQKADSSLATITVKSQTGDVYLNSNKKLTFEE